MKINCHVDEGVDAGEGEREANLVKRSRHVEKG